ncbi:MAG: hypothetical protein IJL85_01170 [Erysipelotrichaceae bacterium]|nr:hypothetical protein [Erysipelotrichaceae bacterium]
MDLKFILVWTAFIAVFLFGVFFSKRLNRQIKEEGIETEGVISRVYDAGQPDEIDIHVCARYTTEDGEEVEGILTNAPDNLVPGQHVRIKYHPRYKENARLIEILSEQTL